MQRSLLVLAALALGATAAAAQGTLGSQGFGYPPGQVSARAQATGGALGEFDAQSPLNPAAILEFGRGSVYAQYSPEIRTVTFDGAEDRSVINRFPIASVAIPVRDRFMIGVSISSLLDRTWETDSAVVVGTAPDTATGRAVFGARGAMSDVRVALAYTVHPTLRVGVGVHALSGRSRTNRELVFPDTSRYTSAREFNEFSYGGLGASIGIDWRPTRTLAIAASGRAGGEARIWRGDTTIATATFPARAGAAIRYSGIAGTTLAVAADWEGWSRLADLSASGVPTFDSWGYSAGAEVRGPTILGTPIPLRVGARRRELPFGLPTGEQVKETSVMGGLGVPIGGGRAGIDFTVGRDSRTAAGGAEERAWTFTAGVVVRL